MLINKVKIFECGIGKIDKLENEINEFIADKEIIGITQSESAEGDTPSWGLTITVWYKENKEP